MNRSQIYYEDVKENMALSEISFGPITTETLVRFSSARNNFHPIHYDKDIAKAEGHSDVLVHGPLKLALFDRLIRLWIGEKGVLKKISATYRAVDFPGNTLHFKGKILSKQIIKSQGYIYCELWAENQEKRITTTGQSVVTLPFKNLNL